MSNARSYIKYLFRSLCVMALICVFIFFGIHNPLLIYIGAPCVLLALLFGLARPLFSDKSGKQSDGNKKVSLDLLLWCATACFYFVVMSLPFVFEPPEGSIVYRADSDLRTYSIAVESYHMDNGAYPGWSIDKTKNDFTNLKDRSGILQSQPTFLRPVPGGPGNLTTPVAYMSTLYLDPFAPVDEADFCYWTLLGEDKMTSSSGGAAPSQQGYIMWSAGPDRQYDLTIQNVHLAFDSKSTNDKPNAFLSAHTYDPTNGANSHGDIWRIGPQ